jgi:hypothetical protein
MYKNIESIKVNDKVKEETKNQPSITSLSSW